MTFARNFRLSQLSQDSFYFGALSRALQVGWSGKGIGVPYKDAGLQCQHLSSLPGELEQGRPKILHWHMQLGWLAGSKLCHIKGEGNYVLLECNKVLSDSAC